MTFRGEARLWIAQRASAVAPITQRMLRDGLLKKTAAEACPAAARQPSAMASVTGQRMRGQSNSR